MNTKENTIWQFLLKDITSSHGNDRDKVNRSEFLVAGELVLRGFKSATVVFLAGHSIVAGLMLSDRAA